MESQMCVSVCARACVRACVRRCVSHLLAPIRVLTFIVGGVVNAEISIPDDGQLHRKTAHLHTIVEILLPWQPE